MLTMHLPALGQVGFSVLFCLFILEDFATLLCMFVHAAMVVDGLKDYLIILPLCLMA